MRANHQEYSLSSSFPIVVGCGFVVVVVFVIVVVVVVVVVAIVDIHRYGFRYDCPLVAR